MNMTVAAPPATKIPQFINGQWVESHASEWLDVVNPATAEVLGRVPISDAAEVTRAIDAAHPHDSEAGLRQAGHERTQERQSDVEHEQHRDADRRGAQPPKIASSRCSS